MPEAVAVRPARTRTVETKTVEQVPVNEIEGTGLGKPWADWLRERTAEELEITEVSIYRYEPAAMKGFLEKLGGFNNPTRCEPIDEGWIASRYGGGTYGVKIYSKDGKSSFDRNVVVAGEPKLSAREKAAQAPAAAPASNGDGLGRLVDVLERTIDRLDRQHAPPATAAPQGAKEIIETMAAIEGFREKLHPAPPAPKSPLEDLQVLLTVVDKLKPAPPVESPLQKALLDAVIAQVTQPKKSLIDELEGLGKLLPLIQNFAGGGEKADWKTALITTAAEKIPDVIEGVNKIMGSRVEEAKAITARAEAVARIRATGAAPIQAGPSSVPVGAGNGVQTSAQTAPAEPPPWKPLNVTPIDAHGHAPAAEASPTPADVIPPGSFADTPLAGAQPTPEMYVDAYLKNRIVQLVATHAEPALVVDVIDAMAPEVGAMLSQATESQVRKFITEDPILREMSGLPHYEAFLEDFIAVLHEAPEPTQVH